ncbi:RNA-directed DNA polymerase [Rhizobium leguminosarum]|uniref:RNA-directed DNA polymerase n=1 Tax=Rhizobium leguminosarum TaxID=384 RepID=UPI001F38F079|nr:RNA-directed DNA polymerase [Rhizobium leguminosarum]UIK19392.1 RNA-directed DNA polymerase [Rhizobium leguminosarum]
MSPPADNILKSLLSRGYFPKELPPAFTTVDFGIHSRAILADWKTAKLFVVKDAKEFPKVDGKTLRRYGYKKLTYADPEVISKPKKLYERRNLQITHPIPQALLTQELADNWQRVQRVLALRKFSEDKIVISEQFDRSVKGINFHLHRAKKNYIEATADWLIKTDISRFYPSVYTHSITWAAYGKETVKNSLKRYDGSFADRLDVLVRACNRNQTIGLPIGPETSRILAEIISSRIDNEFAARFPGASAKRIDRLQDDWHVGASSLEQAETILSLISGCYRDFGLEINGSKTSVTHILASQAESWKSEIAGFLSHRRGALHGTRMEEFLALCLRLQLAAPSEPVMNYALSIVEGRRPQGDDIEVLESFLLKAAAISPASMDRICRIILNIDHENGVLSRGRLSDRFLELAERHFANGAFYEVIWLLYTLRGLKKPFRSKRLCEIAEHAPSSAIRLVLLDLKDKDLLLGPLPVRKWEDELSSERVLADWSWLYAYEATRKGWLRDRSRLLTKPFFKAMADRDVVFYDPRKNVRKSASVKREQKELRKQQYAEAFELLSSLRGVAPDEDEGMLEY